MDDETKQVVAGEVRAWIARRQRSGANVARALGWTEFYLNRRIRGEVPFGVSDLARLAELLDVPIAVFFERPSIATTDRSSSTLVSPAEVRARESKIRYIDARPSVAYDLPAVA